MIIKKRKVPFLILLAIILSTMGYSQSRTSSDVRDFEAWTSIELNYKLNKKWKFGLQEQLRLKEDASTVDIYFTQIEANYSLTKHFAIGASFRYISSNDNTGKIQGYDNYNRYQFDLLYKHKVSNFSFKYRLRYQTKNELGVSKSEGDYADQDLRLKAILGYNIKGWKFLPKLSAEIYNHFEKEQENRLDKFRITLGISYDDKNMGEFGLFYRIVRKLNVSHIKTTNILGFKYRYTIKNKK